MAPASLQYIVSESGERVAVVMSMHDYETLMEHLEDSDAVRAYDEAMAEDDVVLDFEEAMAQIDAERA